MDAAMKNLIRNMVVPVGIGIFFLLFLLPFIGKVHLFDWDEIIFAEAAREMIVTDDYMTVRSDFAPFYEKPPLFIWMQVASMKVFGMNEFAARFPNALCGLITLIALYLIGRKLMGRRFGILWMVTYAFSVLPYFYFKSGIIDPWFNLFTFLSIACFLFYLDPARASGRYLMVSLSALLLGAAVLTKGPVAVLVFTLAFVLFLIIKRPKITVSTGHVLVFMVLLILSGGWWYGVQMLNGNFNTVQDFIAYQAGLFRQDFAGHSGFPGYHFIVLLVGMFPSSVLFMAAIIKKREDTDRLQIFRIYMYILIGIILVLFSLVETKLVHYSSLSYFPVAFLAAWVWENWLERRVEIRRWQRGLLASIVSLLALVSMAFPLILMNSQRIDLSGITDSPFVLEALGNSFDLHLYDLLPGLFLLVAGSISIRRIGKRDARGIPMIYASTLIFVTALMIRITPVAEQITQHAAIEFFKAHAEEDVHLETLGFKSFANLYYGRKDRFMKENGLDRAALLRGESPRDAYFVLKLDNRDRFLEQYPNLVVLYEKNGYVFTRLLCQEK
jgi:4-amino-4-deoxy-L-arabinose transferase-like glycosyltransferase